MSYEKVKSICIDEKQKKVFINCASNNVRPLYYSREEYTYFSKILQEQGKEAVEIALLKSYEGGSLQEGINKYSKALKVLKYVYGEEYKKFNWRNHNARYNTEEHKKERELRESEEFKELLRKAINYKIPKEKYVITKMHGNSKIYGKKCPTCMKWKWNKEEATKFDFYGEAKLNIFEKFKDEWKVEALENKSDDILSQLQNFSGTEHYYKNFTGLIYTDGVKFLSDNLGAYWLIDLIGSYQSHKNNKPFMIWKIEVKNDNSAIITSKEDTYSPILIKQKIPYTDFKLKELELYCIDNVLILKGEY